MPGVLAFVAAYFAPHQHRDPAPALTVTGAAPSVSLTGEQMDAVRQALDSGRMEQTAAAERTVPPAP
jgi:hypothetical protein